MSFLDMAKQLKNMQGEMKKARSILASQTVVGKGGGGWVTVELTGTMDVKKVTVDPKALAKQDASQMERYISEALTDALARAQKMASSQLGSITGLAGKGLFGG